ncbi:sulfotransferase domain-containing protein [Winogradskyella tangerina]|uniref:sulfotransferase domain-containing protein n=1 Tax=Winogradskyella tangerina TaxID=2023240 RepID=UPI000DBE6F71|nr:sulfotransferase domain-containing protein [Winogradskyella tangerina]
MTNIDYAFVTGVGRSGTTFLSHLLSNCKGATIHHEYERTREFQLLSWYLGKTYSIPYLKVLKEDIESKNSSASKFVEVNGGYRHCINELCEVFQTEKVFHLVRNPKDVVRSLYTRRDERNVHFIPKTETEIEWWLKADKFSRICWNWKTDTELLINEGLDILLFEKIISDYDYFKTNLLDKIGLTMDKGSWQNEVQVKKNKTKSKLYRFLYAKYKGKGFVEDRLPKYEDWSDDYKHKFNEICGDTMLKLGYE